MTQPADVDSHDRTRLELVEIQIGKLWELFTRAAHLDTNVEALRDEVRFLTSMWQQIQTNDEALRATQDEVHAVQRQKADTAALHRLRRAGAWSAAVLVAVLAVGAAVVWVGVHDVVLVARQQCMERQAGLAASITRERKLAATDVPATREAHAEAAAAYERMVHPC